MDRGHRADASSADSMARPPLVLWFSAPPRAARGVFNAVSTNWGNEVVFACHSNYREARKELGWAEGDFAAATVEVLSEKQDPIRAANDVMEKYADAVHVFAGFEGVVGDYLASYTSRPGSGSVAVFSERPGAYGPWTQRIPRSLGIPLRHRRLYRSFGGKVAAYLPLGQLGVESAGRFGWPADQLFPFMYCPVQSNPTTQFEARSGASVRLLYVGRFSRYTKGTDTLMRATELVSPGAWSLDLVGGYGDLRDETIAWARQRGNVNFLGSWPADEVTERMKDYDVCVVPSRFDGWNVVVNEAIGAGLGVIATDQAVSSEMVVAGSAGQVVPANDAKALGRAMATATQDRQLVDKWRANAISYAPRVAPPVVGEYFTHVLDHAILRTAERPSCPWL